MSKSKKRLKSRDSGKKKIKVPDPEEVKSDYPIFCFRHLRINCNKDYKFYYDFIVRLNKLSTISWDVINKSDKHGFGTEKIPRHKIKPDLPSFVSPDVEHLTVFRANGDNRPFLGLRIRNVFHIVFVEERFGDVYDHQ